MELKDEPQTPAGVPVSELTPEAARAEMEQFLARVEADMQYVPDVVQQIEVEKIRKFMEGKVSWAEMFNIPTPYLKRLTEFGYLQYRMARYDDAERVFKVLTMLQHRNSYFHTMLGLIYQQQKRGGEAIVEFSLALDLNPVDGVALLHRAEVLTQHGWYQNALTDLERAVAIDGAEEQPWFQPVVDLYARVEQLQKARMTHGAGG